MKTPLAVNEKEYNSTADDMEANYSTPSFDESSKTQPTHHSPQEVAEFTVEAHETHQIPSSSETNNERRLNTRVVTP